MKKTTSWVVMLATVLAAALAQADVTVSGVFGDHMVLQRETKVPVWGSAEPGEKVTVVFRGQTRSTTADAEGGWRVELAPMPASADGAELSVSGKSQVVFKDVVVGEVWLCSGQSNMAYPVRSVFDADKEEAAATNPLIRHLNVPGRVDPVPQRTLHSKWEVCTPETVKNFTAVGYFFGRELHRKLGVPIGLINATSPGSKIEPFIAPDGLRAVSNAPAIIPLVKFVNESDPARPEGRAAYEKAFAAVRTWLPQAEADLRAGKYPPPRPQFPYEGFRDRFGSEIPCMKAYGMIMPVAPYALRGIIWYQGESNGADGYVDKAKALVLGWRSLWGSDLPFYYVQLPGFRPVNWFGFREAQVKIMEAIPRTGMAVALDASDPWDGHPRNKQDVGWRLAQWALAKDYGQTNLVYSGPVCKAQQVETNKIILSFDFVGQGLMAGAKEGLAPPKEDPAGELDEFVIAGPDKKWVAARATIKGNTVVVSSPLVPTPVAVRYAFANCPQGRLLYNRDGLPAGSFRTDTW
jgi:sialate O-acetylesterase